MLLTGGRSGKKSCVKKSKNSVKMASYAQPGAKRQKVRERIDNVDYFQGIDKVEYNNAATHTDTNSYRYYNHSERVHSRPMEDWLKFSISFTDFKNYDPYTKQNRPWDDNTNTLDNNKRCVKALFDLMSKVNVKYWTAYDTDLVPWSDSFEEYKQHWDEMVEYVQELGQKCHVKLLWLAPDLHSHVRYTSGAMTNHDASTFIQAATQTKKCMEMAQRLNAECFLFWPSREGYYSLFQADVQREIKLFAKLLKMTAEYKDRLGFRCQLLIMPYYNYPRFEYRHNFEYNNDVINHYMWDVTSCLYFLKNNNLDRHFKVCSMPGHDLFMANIYNMLGGVTLSNYYQHYDNKQMTLMMKCIVDQGAAPPAGTWLRLRVRRDGDLRDMITLCVRYIDCAARALRVAATMIAEQVFSKHLQQRYVTYYSGFGSRLVSGDVSMEECEEYHKKNQNTEVTCYKSEHLDVVFQRYVDACDHV